MKLFNDVTFHAVHFLFNVNYYLLVVPGGAIMTFLLREMVRTSRIDENNGE